MADSVEQTTPVQDPATSPAPEPVAPAAPPAPPTAPAGAAPWSNDLQQAFDPETAARVDAFLRSNVQPHVTQLEQQAAQAREAQLMYDAFNQDADAANIAVNRQLYGDQYADQLALSLGRPDQVVSQPQQAPQPTQTAPQVQAPQEQQGAPGDPVYDYWAEKYQQEQYDAAKADFLRDPQYADINPELFDPFVAGAETWEDAVGSYRAYAAHFGQSANPQGNELPPQPPPTLGSDAVGAPGSTPAVPRESLDQAIDNMFNENKSLAPPVLGQQ